MKFDEPRASMFELRTFLNSEKFVPNLRCPARRQLAGSSTALFARSSSKSASGATSETAQPA
jgi:hypothetical protein